MKETMAPRRHRSGWLGGFALSVPILFQNCPPSQPAAPNKNVICFRDTGAFPSSGAPAIDGNPAELNWTGSFRYVFPNAVGVPHGIVQGLKDSTALYLSFEINNDPFFNDKDTILLGFSPGGGAANDRRIFIFPNCDAVSPCNNNGNPGPPRTVLYWNNSGTWANTSGVTDPSWLTNTGNPALSNIRVASPGPNQWQVEIKIPISNVTANADPNLDAGINFPASGNFRFWFDVIRVTSAPGTPPPLAANELAWPPGVAYGSNQSNLINLRQNMPAVNTWGSGRRDATNACNGVTVEWSDIKVEHPDTVSAVGSDLISLNKQNVFTVTPWNDSVNQSNTYVSAEGITATFKIRNLGLPGPNFQMVGALRGNPPANNPTSALPIPAAVAPNTFGTAKLSTGVWKLNGQEVTDYTAHSSQCVLVDIDTNASPAPIILNKSAHANMTFITTNSPFRVAPTVDMAGYKPRDGSDQLEFILSTFTYHTDRDLPWSTEMQGVQQIGRSQYLLRGRPGAQASLATTVTPPDIRIPSVDVKVAPGTGGAAHKAEVVRVRPGDVLTVFTDGAVRVRREGPGNVPAAGPEGIRLARSDRQPADRPSAFLLGYQHDPASRVGALVGSWDNFGKTSFVVGQFTTMKVPAGAEALYLAINDTADGFAQHSGEGFQVQVVETSVEQKYVSTDSRLARDPAHEMIRMPVAANLPMWILCGERKTGKMLAIDQDSFELTENVNCFGYALRRIGR
jgi:hypothetical protein